MKKSKLLAVVLVFVMTLSLLPTAALANEKAVYTGTGYATSVSVVKGETDDVFVSSTIFRNGTKLYGSKTDDEHDVIAAIKYRTFGSDDSYVDVPDEWIANRSDNKFYFNTTNIAVGSYDIQITLNFTGTFNNGTKDDSDDEAISVTGIIADTTLEVFPDITGCEEPLVLTVADLTASYTKIGQMYLPIPFKVMCGENDISGIVEIKWEKVEGVTMQDSDPEKGSDGTYTFGYLYPYQAQICGKVPITAWAVYGEGASAKESNHVTFYVTMTDCDQMFAAQIGSTGYATLADAIEDAEPGDTIELYAGTYAAITLNKAVNIKGAGVGKTIINAADSNERSITYTAYGDGQGKALTVEGVTLNGVIKYCGDGLEAQNNEYNLAHSLANYKLYVKNCAFTDSVSDLCIQVDSWTKDCELYVQNTKFTSAKCCVSMHDDGPQSATEKDKKSFTTFALRNKLCEFDATADSSFAYAVQGYFKYYPNGWSKASWVQGFYANANDYFIDRNSSDFSQMADNDYDTCNENSYAHATSKTNADVWPAEAKIGNKFYATLAAALNAAKSGDTVTLLQNVETTSTITIDKKSITIDGSNKTIKRTNNGDVLNAVYADGVHVTIQNLTIDGNGAGGAFNWVMAAEYKDNSTPADKPTLNIQSCTFTNTRTAEGAGIGMWANSTGGWFKAAASEVTINGCTFTNVGAGIYYNEEAPLLNLRSIVTNNTFQNLSWTGIAGIPANAEIANNTFASTCGEAIQYLFNKNQTQTATSIHDNVIESATGIQFMPYHLAENNAHDDNAEVNVTADMVPAIKRNIRHTDTDLVTLIAYRQGTDEKTVFAAPIDLSENYANGTAPTVKVVCQNGTEQNPAPSVESVTPQVKNAPYYKADTMRNPYDLSNYVIPSGGGSSGGSSGGSTTTPSQPTTSTETKPDGSTTTTETKPDGTVTESNTSKPVTGADGSTSQTTTETTTGKDGVTESKTETTTNKDGSGSATTETTVTKPDGTKTESTTETTINKDGSTASTTTSTTTNKDGTVTESKTEATTSTVTNKDGSTTETKQETTTTSTGSKTESTTVTTVNKDGSTTATTTATTTDKAGTVTESKTESTTNKNGTTKETTSTTETKANGTVTESKTETTINKDGSSKATTTETVTKADGTTTTSKTTATTSLSTNKSTGTVTETKKETTTTSDGVKSEGTTVTQIQKDGTVTSKETVKASDSTGTTATKTTTLDAKGEVTTKAEAAVSTKAVTEAAKTGAAVTIPVEVTATKSTSTAPTVAVSVPKTAESVKVELPVQNVTPGTVAVIVNADGTEKIVSTSMVTENGVALTLDGSATVKLVDNSKSFKDVPNTNVFYNEISSLSAREIMIGKTGDKFDLHNSVTLNQTANVAGRITGAVDVSDFNAGVAWGQANGLKIGNVAATRGDVLKALYIAAGSPAVEDTTILSRFKDSASIPADMTAIAAWAAQNGILKGNTDGTAGLSKYVSRGQACALAGRTMGTLA